MNTSQAGLDAAFIEKQRQYLIRLRATLKGATEGIETEEADLRNAAVDNPAEYEDDAQKLAALDVDDSLLAREVERLQHIDRALQKIADGTYGLSDRSGLPIPRERLEAVPEAIYTLKEEERTESPPRS
jgi:DnaK suppressor protein